MTIDWVEFWRQTASLPESVPAWVVAGVAIFFIYLLVIIPFSGFMSYADRKFSADLQARVGPNRSGLAGLFQPLADFSKLLQKDARSAPSLSGTLWLGLHTMALYSTVAVLPLGSLILLVDTDMSAFLPFWAALVLALGTMLLGMNQSSIPGWFGGVRVAAQSMAGGFPGLIAIICAGISAGGFKWTGFASVQSASPLDWIAFSNPFQFIAFIVFVISGLVILGVPPVDGGISIPDIHGGVASELSGRRISLFRLGRFYGFFLWSVISVVLFLGGWNLPALLTESLRSSEAWMALQILEMSVVLMKTLVLMIAVTLVARVTPRIRVDQITDFAWKILSPFSLAALVGSAIWSGGGL